jgi:hypothetical protein
MIEGKTMGAKTILAWVVFPLVSAAFAGCASERYAKRQAAIDGAHERGEITLVEREQMTHGIEQERLQRNANALRAMQSMQSSQQQPSGPTIIYPRGQSYNVYDRNGNQTGTLQPR